MKSYINEFVSYLDIIQKGFKPFCNGELFIEEELKDISNFILNNVVNSKIKVNPDFTNDDLEDLEYDWEIYGGDIEIKCSTIEEGKELANIFEELTQMRCSVNYFKDNVAYCDFESE